MTLSLGVKILIGAGTSIVCSVLLYFGIIKYAKYLKKCYHNGTKTIWFNGYDKYNKPKSQQLPPLNKLLKRGDIIVRDFRSNNNKNDDDNKINNNKENNRTLRVVSLNMEMGKQINKIISSLKSLNADIIFLQEVDVSTPRSNFIDIIAELSTELNMNSLFTVEVMLECNEISQGAHSRSNDFHYKIFFG